MTPFKKILEQRSHSANSLLCVGLDPDPSRFPAHIRLRDDAIFTFCRDIVDATAELVCAFKPQIAYFAAHRAEDQLEELITHIHRHHPGIPVILDAKRGDIGATSDQYAREVFERYKADAVTVQPYQGIDAIAPYLAYSERGVFILCRTSNPGGDVVQMFRSENGEALYEHIARLACHQWNPTGALGLVVGATYPAQLAHVRAIVGDMPLLVPGIGAQGGSIEACVKAGQTAQGLGMVVNSSRAILYAGQDEDYAQQAYTVARATRDDINQYRNVLTAP